MYIIMMNIACHRVIRIEIEIGMIVAAAVVDVVTTDERDNDGEIIVDLDGIRCVVRHGVKY